MEAHKTHFVCGFHSRMSIADSSGIVASPTPAPVPVSDSGIGAIEVGIAGTAPRHTGRHPRCGSSRRDVKYSSRHLRVLREDDWW